LFRVTTALITFLAAGLCRAKRLVLSAGGNLTALSQTPGIRRRSFPTPACFGRVLHTLIGYSDSLRFCRSWFTPDVDDHFYAVEGLFAAQPHTPAAADAANKSAGAGA